MAKRSAGLVMFRVRAGRVEVLLVHPGGPFWARKDLGAWSIPKGEYADGEDALTAAKREFREETGIEPRGEFIALRPVRLASGKQIAAWAIEGDCDASAIRSNTFQLEWPPKSGKVAEFPEVDRADWFELEEAKKKINKGQAGLLEALQKRTT